MTHEPATDELVAMMATAPTERASPEFTNRLIARIEADGKRIADLNGKLSDALNVIQSLLGEASVDSVFDWAEQVLQANGRTVPE